MSEKVNVDNLAKELKKYLEDYAEDITEGVIETTNSLGKEAKKELQEKSPKLTGDYAKGWAINKKKSKNNHKYTIKLHNKTDYQLTHLLEFGHAKKNGGYVSAKPHIREVEEKYKKLYETKITTVIKRRSKK